MKIPKTVSSIVRFISILLKVIWLFFPGILFLFLTIFCFWIQGQGKDIIVAFIDNKSPDANTFTGENIFRLLFFIATGFWVYVSWYFSRIISYVKIERQVSLQQDAGISRAAAERSFDNGGNYFEISKKFLDIAPRIIGNGCFIILELAILQSPILINPISTTAAVVSFFILLLVTWYIDYLVDKRQFPARGADKIRGAPATYYNRLFKTLLYIFCTLIIISSLFKLRFITGTSTGILWMLFVLLILFHVVFIYYVNLRRSALHYIRMKTGAAKAVAGGGLLKKVMHYLSIPPEEVGYFRWFLIISVAGLLCYFASILFLGFARYLTPFPVLILGFTSLLVIGNIVTTLSVRYRLNLHFFIILAALIIGTKETHQVKTFRRINNYSLRPDLKKYLTAWLQRDTTAAADTSGYDIYFVISNGGASRSGYWTATVLGTLEDASIRRNPNDRFSSHLFGLSGTSGGDVGLSTFFSLLNQKDNALQPWYDSSSMNFLRRDYFSYTIARMLGPDYFKYIFPFRAADRAAALEESLENSCGKTSNTFAVPFDSSFSSFRAMDLENKNVMLPLLFINTTRMQDGNPGVVTNLNISGDSASKDSVRIFNKRIDVVTKLPPDHDFTIATASVLGARFPYLSPAGEIANNYFVDGGYFDNSGAGVVQELIRGILKIASEDTTHQLQAKIKKLNFKLIHIVNSPVIEGADKFKSVAPIRNDLLSPLITVMGAYDMQTTVNDVRLINYINDINQPGPDHINASYTRISLYEDQQEWKADTKLNMRFETEPSYAMNWFMSDSTARRINNRLLNNRVLDSLLKKGLPAHN